VLILFGFYLSELVARYSFVRPELPSHRSKDHEFLSWIVELNYILGDTDCLGFCFWFLLAHLTQGYQLALRIQWLPWEHLILQKYP